MFDESSTPEVGIEKWLADPIKACMDESQLRRCACDFARFALAQCVDVDERVRDAIDVAGSFANGKASGTDLAKTRAVMEEAFGEAESLEIDLQDKKDENLESFVAYYNATARARAAGAALGAVHEKAKWAVELAAYEARFAIGIRHEIESFELFKSFIDKLASTSNRGNQALEDCGG